MKSDGLVMRLGCVVLIALAIGVGGYDCWLCLSLSWEIVVFEGVFVVGQCIKRLWGCKG